MYTSTTCNSIYARGTLYFRQYFVHICNLTKSNEHDFRHDRKLFRIHENSSNESLIYSIMNSNCFATEAHK